MKDLKNYILEKCSSCEEEEREVKNEKDFRAWAEAKFKEVFKDELDEKKMNDTIDGFLKDHKDLVDKEEWSELVGMMNVSFAK